jgi:UDP-glucuronate 4-epimerase
MKMTDMQPGDVKETSADTSELNRWVNFKPNTSIKEGVKQFVDWYKTYY